MFNFTRVARIEMKFALFAVQQMFFGKFVVYSTITTFLCKCTSGTYEHECNSQALINNYIIIIQSCSNSRP